MIKPPRVFATGIFFDFLISLLEATLDIVMLFGLLLYWMCLRFWTRSFTSTRIVWDWIGKSVTLCMFVGCSEAGSAAAFSSALPSAGVAATSFTVIYWGSCARKFGSFWSSNALANWFFSTSSGSLIYSTIFCNLRASSSIKWLSICVRRVCLLFMASSLIW